jgi:hypothetical protein
MSIIQSEQRGTGETPRLLAGDKVAWATDCSDAYESCDIGQVACGSVPGGVAKSAEFC